MTADPALLLGLPGKRYGRLTLPEDDRMHPDAGIEWWYASGHLVDDQRRRYGFHFAVFKIDGRPYRVGDVEFTRSYRVDTAIAEISARRFHCSTRVLTPGPLQRMNPDVLDIQLGPTRMTAVGPYTYRLTTRWGGSALDLTAAARCEPVVHGDGGWVEMSGAGGSYYSSITRLSTKGMLDVDGRNLPVAGTSWLDHQWGSWDLSARPRWDWFSVRLDDGTDVMAYAFPGTSQFATVRHPGGTAAPVCFDYQAVGTWVSPRTGTGYPSGWTVQVPDLRASLVVTPELSDQEVVNERDAETTYWEGSCRVSGMRDRLPVTGRAYVELCGYG